MLQVRLLSKLVQITKYTFVHIIFAHLSNVVVHSRDIDNFISIMLNFCMHDV